MQIGSLIKCVCVCTGVPSYIRAHVLSARCLCHTVLCRYMCVRGCSKRQPRFYVRALHHIPLQATAKMSLDYTRAELVCRKMPARFRRSRCRRIQCDLALFRACTHTHTHAGRVNGATFRQSVREVCSHINFSMNS